MRKTELENCTFIKTVLMFVIVLYHSVYYAGISLPDELRNKALLSSFYGISVSWFNSFQNYAFFLVSGYIFAFVKYERGGYGSFLPFIKAKALRLLVPFAFATFFWSVPIRFFFLKHSLKQIMKNAVLAADPDQYWFLLALFGVFVVFWLLSDLFKNKPVIGLLAVLLSYFCGTYLMGRFENYFCLFSAMQMMPWFFLGFCLRVFGTDRIKKIPLPCLAVIHLFFLWLQTKCGNPLTHFITGLAGVIFAFNLLQFIASRFEWKTNGIFKRISKYAMPVYLFHYQLIYLFDKAVGSRFGFFPLTVLSFIVATAVSVILAEVLLSNKYTRFLLGEK